MSHFFSTHWRLVQDQAEHEHFRRLLEAPKTVTESLMKDRLPVPRLVRAR